MKKATGVRYPHSASLFSFCRRVLDHRYGGVRVIDQDVGQILGFDPADCSHWKKGKKNVRSIHDIKNIAQHLGVDEKLIVDVASGDLDEIEGFFEFGGYGAFAVDTQLLDSAKKEYYRTYAGDRPTGADQRFQELFTIDVGAIDTIVDQIHERVGLTESPLYLPEVVGAYPDIALQPDSELKENDEVAAERLSESGKFTIRYSSGRESRPFMRFQIGRAMGKYFLPRNDDKMPKLDKYCQHVMDVKTNLFASRLLVPAKLVRQEMGRIDVGKDIVSQLAESFWVSRSLMNRRLKEILQG